MGRALQLPAFEASQPLEVLQVLRPPRGFLAGDEVLGAEVADALAVNHHRLAALPWPECQAESLPASLFAWPGP